jgi:hypothetical protein
MADDVLRFYQDDLDSAKGEKAFPGMGESVFQREKRAETERKTGAADEVETAENVEVPSPDTTDSGEELT